MPTRPHPARPAALAALALTLAGACRSSSPPAVPAPPPPPASDAPFWSQWGGGPGHAGGAPVAAQPLGALLADLTLDPFAPAEQAETGGSLLVHYPAPLTDGPDLYVAWQGGTFTPCAPPGSGSPEPCGPAAWGGKVWGVARHRWEAGRLTAWWRTASDWKPPPAGASPGAWEPVFHPALAGGRLWVPGAGGSVLALDKTTGAVLSRADPFGGDPSTYVAGPLTADADGNVIYTALRLQPGVQDPWLVDALGAWLVKVSPAGAVTRVAWATLVAGAPAAGDACETSFATAQLPWPPSPGAAPPTVACGTQRPGLNAAPAVGPGGTIFAVSRAHFSDREAWLLAVNPDLTPRWHRSLRGLLADGCGVLVPVGTSLSPPTPNACRAGTPADGRDPATNGPPAARVLDSSSSSPVALPDGGVLYGAYTRYNLARGHLLRLGPGGDFLGAYDFGWDSTPALWVHGGTWSVVTKDNHYEGLGLYCSGPNPVCAPLAGGPYDITQLDAALVPEWRLRNTTTESCTRGPAGVSCVPDPDHPNGFEWCINAPVVDAAGTVHAIAEDGFLYSVGQGASGVTTAWKERVFMLRALGAAYTPLSLGPEGRVYAQNAGHLFAVGATP